MTSRSENLFGFVKTVLITGRRSGIARAASLTFAQAGARVGSKSSSAPSLHCVGATTHSRWIIFGNSASRFAHH